MPARVGTALVADCAEAGETSDIRRIFVDTKALHGNI